MGNYGSPTTNLAGCTIELGSCSANTKSITEYTAGFWYALYKGPIGKLDVAVQAALIKRTAFDGVDATKGSKINGLTTNETLFMFSGITIHSTRPQPQSRLGNRHYPV